MLYMIVKGSKKVSLDHALKNGITNPVFKHFADNGRESILEAEDTEENNNNASKWFVNNDYGYQAPFSPGSLLHYSWSEIK
jgi:hypothetical protein